MLKYIRGDLFSHTANGVSILAHACNPFGLWGGGIALQFRKRYPHAYRLYQDHCRENGSDLLGKCLLIPAEAGSSNIWVACLFTSDFDCSPSQILDYTLKSISDLDARLTNLADVEMEAGKPVVNMPQINSGIFNVPWEDTELILKRHETIHFNVYTL